jgi:hypothetical protein
MYDVFDFCMMNEEEMRGAIETEMMSASVRSSMPFRSISCCLRSSSRGCREDAGSLAYVAYMYYAALGRFDSSAWWCRGVLGLLAWEAPSGGGGSHQVGTSEDEACAHHLSRESSRSTSVTCSFDLCSAQHACEGQCTASCNLCMSNCDRIIILR